MGILDRTSVMYLARRDPAP